MATEGPCCAGVCLCERESHRILYLRGDGAEMKIKVLTRMGVAVGVCGAERAFQCRIIACGDSQTMCDTSLLVLRCFKKDR